MFRIVWFVTALALTYGMSNSREALAQTCGYSACAWQDNDYCDDGRWPNGVIHYKFAAGVTAADRGSIRYAMNDWQRITNNIIEFVETTASSTSQNPVITIEVPGGKGAGYAGCVRNPSGCVARMTTANVYHELGHCIGPNAHYFQRYDARHYLMYHDTPTQNCNQPRCPIIPEKNLIDFGPFSFKSTMLYDPKHPDFSRWDGSPVTPRAACNNYGTRTQPPDCRTSANTFWCPTCTNCAVAQPYGFPTKEDASAVVESYNIPNNWRKFLRTVNEVVNPGRTQRPFDYSLNRGVSIPDTASPAVSTWENGTLSFYVRGNDGQIYQKYRDTTSGSWSSWRSHSRPSVRGDISDPAVTSWGRGREDVVVRVQNSIYIKTYNWGWGAWESLGGPGIALASAPTITSWGTDRLDVLVRGGDDRMYHRACSSGCNGASGNWSNWKVVPGGTFRGKPSAVSRAPGIIDVFVHGMDDRLWAITKHFNDWGSWNRVPVEGTLKWDPACPDCYSPAAASRSQKSIDVFVRGVDDKLWITSWNGNWSGYHPLGGVLRASPGTFSRVRTTNRVDVAINMREERTAGNYVNGVWWKEYEK